MGVELYTGKKIDAADTLIIFDEVQEVPRALASLKYFYEDAPQYHVICAGSLLGVALHKGTSFPVGKVDFLQLYPLSFTEILGRDTAKANQVHVHISNGVVGGFDILRTFRLFGQSDDLFSSDQQEIHLFKRRYRLGEWLRF